MLPAAVQVRKKSSLTTASLQVHPSCGSIIAQAFPPLLRILNNGNCVARSTSPGALKVSRGNNYNNYRTDIPCTNFVTRTCAPFSSSPSHLPVIIFPFSSSPVHLPPLILPLFIFPLSSCPSSSSPSHLPQCLNAFAPFLSLRSARTATRPLQSGWPMRGGQLAVHLAAAAAVITATMAVVAVAAPVGTAGGRLSGC